MMSIAELIDLLFSVQRFDKDAKIRIEVPDDKTYGNMEITRSVYDIEKIRIETRKGNTYLYLSAVEESDE